MHYYFDYRPVWSQRFQIFLLTQVLIVFHSRQYAIFSWNVPWSMSPTYQISHFLTSQPLHEDWLHHTNNVKSEFNGSEGNHELWWRTAEDGRNQWQNVQSVSISVCDRMLRPHKQLANRLFMSYFRVSCLPRFSCIWTTHSSTQIRLRNIWFCGVQQDVLCSYLREEQMSRPI